MNKKDKKLNRYNWRFWLSKIFLVTLIMSIVFSIIAQDWWVLFYSIFALILMMSPSIIERNFLISLPLSFEVIFFFLIYSSIFLGEARDYYFKFPWWDLVLHATSGFFTGFIGFTAIYIFFTRNKLLANPIIISLFAFCMSVSVGSLWEVFEYFIDIFFGTNMQRSGLVDTMGDLILNFIGALFVATLGYLYIKYKKRTIV